MKRESPGRGKGFEGDRNPFSRSRLIGAPRPRLEPAEERRLLAAARRGDPGAVRRLLATVSGTVYRYGRSFCRDPDDAEDVLQDVLLALLDSLPRFRGEAALTTWAFVVARRTCAKRRRRDARFTPLEGAAGRKALRVRDPGGSPSRALERRRMAASLERAIAALPPGQREVLILRDAEGRSAAEVAGALGLGERAVKSRLHRARLALRRALGPERGAARAPEARAPGCPDVARAMSRFLEGEVDPAACARLESHVAACPGCGATCRSMRRVLGRCRDWGSAPIPPRFRERVRAAIRRAVAARGRTAPRAPRAAEGRAAG